MRWFFLLLGITIQLSAKPFEDIIPSTSDETIIAYEYNSQGELSRMGSREFHVVPEVSLQQICLETLRLIVH